MLEIIIAGKLADGAVTGEKIANGTVSEDKLDLEFSYSLSEVNTHTKWIDGKDIYKKTINFGALPNATIKNVAHGITSITWVVKIETIARRGTAGYSTLPLVYHSTDASFNTSIFVDGENLQVQTTQDRSVYTLCYITMYYTKTS